MDTAPEGRARRWHGNAENIRRSDRRNGWCSERRWRTARGCAAFSPPSRSVVVGWGRRRPPYQSQRHAIGAIPWQSVGGSGILMEEIALCSGHARREMRAKSERGGHRLQALPPRPPGIPPERPAFRKRGGSFPLPNATRPDESYIISSGERGWNHEAAPLLFVPGVGAKGIFIWKARA